MLGRLLTLSARDGEAWACVDKGAVWRESDVLRLARFECNETVEERAPRMAFH